MFQFQIISFISLLCCVLGQDRKITSLLNPGCPECTEDITLAYIKAEGTQDAIHQIWDFTGGCPVMIFAVAGVNSSLDISWVDMKPKSFKMSEKPYYSFATAIDKMYEYDDLEDNGHIDNKSPSRAIRLELLQWTHKSIVMNDKQVMVALSGRNMYTLGNGTINLKLNFLPFKDSAIELPHLIHTANSSLVDINLVNLTTSKEYNASRFALHFVLVSTDNWKDTMHYTMRKSLDDEHTPGVFEIIEIKTPEAYSRGDGGFVQFRPVGYTEPERGVSSSTIAHVSNFNRTRLPEGTLKSFYRHFDYDLLLVQDMFVSFGEAGDGFYKQHNYTSWSYTIGYGSPPVESVSLFVIVIISIGLGIPVLLALSGIMYVIVRRYNHRRNLPTRFTDDD